MKHIFIVNKTADNGKIGDKIKGIYDICKALDLDFQIFIPRCLEDIKSVVKRSIGSESIVYAVGGDGTVNVLLNELIGTDLSLGVLPLGSGNDFYKTITEEVTNCNVLKVNDRYCINIFSIGIDAEICKNAEKMKKLKIPSSQIYNASIAYTFFKHKPIPLSIRVDESFYEDEMNLVAVCNGAFYGGGYCINPDASLTSSQAQVYMLHSISKMAMPFFLKKVIDGTHENYPRLTKTVGQEIVIETNHPTVANIDGEILVSDSFKIDAAAARINVIKNKPLIRELQKRKLSKF